MNRAIVWIAPAVIVVIVGGFLLYKHFAAPPAASQKSVQVGEPPQTEDHFPVPENAAAEQKPLPTLDQSDGPAREALGSLVEPSLLERVLVPNDLVRHVVVTVDNLPRKKVALQLRPIKPVTGEFAVSGTEDSRTLGEQNYARYESYVKAVQMLNVEQFGTAYRHFYPLLQQSYQDLGYPKGYFNDRLVQAIDDLLATPNVSGPIKLVQPSVEYQYADPKLEALSAGQKTLLRMGPQNMAIVKGKLRELRGEITKKQG
jgi:hypothetical protein